MGGAGRCGCSAGGASCRCGRCRRCRHRRLAPGPARAPARLPPLQVVAREHVRAAEERERVHEARRAAAAEEAYLARVAESAQRVDPPQWFGRKKVDWFS